METVTYTPNVSKGAFWGGWVMSVLPCLLLLMSAAFKFIQGPEFEAGVRQMGWEPRTMMMIGIIEVAVVVLYLIPKTSVIGAILITAYMGGAVATHVRVGDAFFIQVLVGVLVWGGLFLRDPRIRALIPLRS
jgi:hypothetical protein